MGTVILVAAAPQVAQASLGTSLLQASASGKGDCLVQWPQRETARIAQSVPEVRAEVWSRTPKVGKSSQKSLRLCSCQRDWEEGVRQACSAQRSGPTNRTNRKHIRFLRVKILKMGLKYTESESHTNPMFERWWGSVLDVIYPVPLRHSWHRVWLWGTRKAPWRSTICGQKTYVSALGSCLPAPWKGFSYLLHFLLNPEI